MLPLIPHFGTVLPIQKSWENTLKPCTTACLYSAPVLLLSPTERDECQPVKEMFASFKNKQQQRHTQSTAREMTQRAVTCAPKPEDPSLLPRPHMAEGTNCCKLSSTPYMLLLGAESKGAPFTVGIAGIDGCRPTAESEGHRRLLYSPT